MYQIGKAFSIGELRFRQVHGPAILTEKSDYPEFIIVKTEEMIEDYIDRFQKLKIDNLLELGIMKGGSIALMNVVAKPKTHLAIDVIKQEHGLDQFALDVAKDGRSLIARYDISQSDTAAILQAFEAQAGVGAMFDVIIDDATHRYDLSLASFNGLFPRVRPGGFYAIEDWGWAHWPNFQDTTNEWYNDLALSNLISHCVAACTADTGGISHIEIKKSIAFIYRDASPLPSDFNVATCFPARGRAPHAI